MVKEAVRISLGRQLSLSGTILHLGLRCNWDEYTREEQALIVQAGKIYFPTIFYAHVFHAMGKEIFPSLSSYNLLGDKIRQTCLFEMLQIPHPRTRFFWGSKRAEKILAEFRFPFIGKIPRASSRGRGVFFIDSPSALKGYLKRVNTAYIQEYVPIDRDIRVVLIGRDIVLSYWKIGAPDDFRTNVARGSRISLEDVPEEALELVRDLSARSGIDHAGFDICMTERGPLVFEANIHFGTEGFKEAGLSYREVIADMADAFRI
jgi:ribosomal protein S6--L-glutamate ligase